MVGTRCITNSVLFVSDRSRISWIPPRVCRQEFASGESSRSIRNSWRERYSRCMTPWDVTRWEDDVRVTSGTRTRCPLGILRSILSQARSALEDIALQYGTLSKVILFVIYSRNTVARFRYAFCVLYGTFWNFLVSVTSTRSYRHDIGKIWN